MTAARSTPKSAAARPMVAPTTRLFRYLDGIQERIDAQERRNRQCISGERAPLAEESVRVACHRRSDIPAFGVDHAEHPFASAGVHNLFENLHPFGAVPLEEGNLGFYRGDVPG